MYFNTSSFTTNTKSMFFLPCTNSSQPGWVHVETYIHVCSWIVICQYSSLKWLSSAYKDIDQQISFTMQLYLNKFFTCNLPMQLLLCVRNVANKHLTSSNKKILSIWTIIRACNTSYVLPQRYTGDNSLDHISACKAVTYLLPYKYTWDNKSVFLPYFIQAYNRMVLLIQSAI